MLCWCLASVHCSPKEYRADVSKIESLRSQVVSSFEELVVQLEERKYELLKELDEKEEELLREQQETDKLIRILEDGHEYSQVNYEQSEFLKSFNDQHVRDIGNKLRELKFNRNKSIVVFVWDDGMFEDLHKRTKIIVKENIPYHEKIHPIVQTSRYGYSIGEIKPRGLTIDPKTNNIFVADCFNHRIQVFDPVGNYLYKFGENDPGTVRYPEDIAICGDRVYVSHFEKYVNIYDLKGAYIGQFGNTGAKSEITSDPKGIAVSEENGDIFVCNHDKDTILVYSKDLRYKTRFGKGKLTSPRDIELTQDRIYVLDLGDPCIHVFNRDHSYSHSIVNIGEGMEVGHSIYFALDMEENILLTDFNKNVIRIFNKEGSLIHQIGEGTDYLYKPYGIAINGMNRIVVADIKDEGNLKIF